MEGRQSGSTQGPDGGSWSISRGLAGLGSYVSQVCEWTGITGDSEVLNDEAPDGHEFATMGTTGRSNAPYRNDTPAGPSGNFVKPTPSNHDADGAHSTIFLKGRQASDPGIITTGEVAKLLRDELPIFFQFNSTFTLLYSTYLHGTSLNTLLDRAHACRKPTLLVVRSTHDRVFGGFATVPWNSRGQYHGTGESMLWRLEKSRGGNVRVEAYRWSNKNSYFMIALARQYIAMGGGSGSFGLWLDETLTKGHSGSCETFNNPPLAGVVDFDIAGVEFWAIDDVPLPKISRSDL